LVETKRSRDEILALEQGGKFKLGCSTIAAIWLVQVFALTGVVQFVLPCVGKISLQGGFAHALLIAVLLNLINIVVRLLVAMWIALAYTAGFLMFKDLDNPEAFSQTYGRTFAKYIQPFRKSKVLAWAVISWPLTSVALKVLSDCQPDTIVVDGWTSAFAGGLVVSAVNFLISATWLIRRSAKSAKKVDNNEPEDSIAKTKT